MVSEQSPETLDGHLVQALSLRGQPLLERTLRHRDPREQIAAVEARELLERGGAAVGDEALELGHVHVDHGGGQGHARSVEDQAGLRPRRQGLADARERVAQVAAGLRLLHVAPEEGRELLARVRLTERERQIRQQRQGLAGRKHQRGARVELRPEASK
jgi:hypothetical protein